MTPQGWVPPSSATGSYGNSYGREVDQYPNQQKEEGGILGTAMSWARSAGEKLADVEAAVWKKINDAHGGDGPGDSSKES